MNIRKKIIFLLSLSLSGSLSYSKNKIIYLISPPRSLSTAFLRMVEARGDFAIFHEPSQAPFRAKKYPTMDSLYSESTPKTPQTVKNSILKAAEKSNVFIKAMSFAEIEFLPYDEELLCHKDIYFVFLMRNPHSSIVSLHLKNVEFFGEKFVDSIIDNDSYRSIFGYKSLYKLINIVEKHAVNPIHFIKTEDLYTTPEQTIRRFCKAVSIPFLSYSLSWRNLGKGFDHEQYWRDGKDKETVYIWHGDAIYSNSFHTPRKYKVDVNGNPTFEEIQNLKHRTYLIEGYEESLIYYKRILNKFKQ